MKGRQLSTLAAAILISVSPMTSVWAQQTAEDIPAGIATPDEMDTRLGKLTSVDSAPSEDTVEVVCNLVWPNFYFQPVQMGKNI